MEIINGKRIVPKNELEEIGFGVIYDGGLVIGRKHSEGVIEFLFPIDEDFKSFEWSMTIEGGEFIVNDYATTLYADRIREINSYMGDEEYITVNDIDLLETLDNIIYVGDTDRVIISAMPVVSIINHSATRKYLYELIEINNKAKEEYFKIHSQESF